MAVRSVGTRILFMLGEVDAAESKWADTMNSASTQPVIYLQKLSPFYGYWLDL